MFKCHLLISSQGVKEEKRRLAHVAKAVDAYRKADDGSNASPWPGLDKAASAVTCLETLRKLGART